MITAEYPRRVCLLGARPGGARPSSLVHAASLSGLTLCGCHADIADAIGWAVWVDGSQSVTCPACIAADRTGETLAYGEGAEG